VFYKKVKRAYLIKFFCCTLCTPALLPMIAIPFQSPEYILPKNNLNKNYFRFSKVTLTNEKSTSHVEGNQAMKVSRQPRLNTDCEATQALCGLT
jgi:hypothetical protein